jgi:HAD superfamily hydrolase (TIGR01509 family)
MIKLVIFDLDGVLVNTKEIHYDSLNDALGEKYNISWEEHLSKYDGLKTNQKLSLLSLEKNLPVSDHESIWIEKQKLTLERLSTIEQSKDLIYTLKNLVDLGYKIACCSNSIRKTVLMVLSKLGIIEFFDYIVSNEDVNNSKPHPEMYWKTISQMGLLPEETLIVEDSPFGLLAASRSKSHIMRVTSPDDVTFENIKNYLKNAKMENSLKWKNDKLNVLIPMAGAGSRFENAGYTFPKPLIDVKGSPMIQIVVNNLSLDANYIYVVQKSHRTKYNLDSLLNLITPNCTIIEVDGLTEGAACTALLAKEFIDNENPLFFANSDQFVEWDSNEFMYKMQETNIDGGIVTFESIHPKWSFAKLDENGYVTEVSEKNPISNVATVGYYYWKNGSDFVKYAEQMIQKDVRVNNEFYVCPVFNEAINSGKKIITFNAKKMWGLGTPEDLEYYIKNYNNG